MEETKKSFSAVKAIQQVGLKIENSGLKPEKLLEIESTLKELSEFLNLTEKQTIFFVTIYIVSALDFYVSMTQILSFLDIDRAEAFIYLNDLNSLFEKRYASSDYLSSDKVNTTVYSYDEIEINDHVKNAILNDTPIKDIALGSKLDVYQFCTKVMNWSEKRNYKRYPTFVLSHVINQLELDNTHLDFITLLKNNGIEIEDRILLYNVAYNHFELNTKTELNLVLPLIYDEMSQRISKLKEIANEESALVKDLYILTSKSSFMNDTSVYLSEKTLVEFFGKDADFFEEKEMPENVMTYEGIKSKKLFFEPKLDNELRMFKDSINDANFIALQNRLAENGYIQGVTAVFYGSPGTGKTESAYQIARETKRNIFKIDISNTKSMWFGQSEKVIKKIFSDYKSLVQRTKVTPILLLNEADAILGKRMKIRHQSVDQTENAIQNIILEELENFTGILIATTNLAGNFDAAFERRFLYKINFSKPTVEAKIAIWKNKLSWLDTNSAELLANKYDFSGGEIDNIVRKVFTNEIIKGSAPLFEDVIKYCDSERFTMKRSTRKIGYC